MPKYPVLQPDGRLAVWSTITDTFSRLDCTVDEAVDSLLQWHTGFVASNVTRPELHDMVGRCAAGEMVYPFWRDWAHLVAWTTHCHNSDEQITGGLMERTPDPMTRRYIEQFVATCKEESRADDANIALTAMTQRAEAAEAQLRIEQDTLMDLARENGHNIVNDEDSRREAMVYRVLLTGAMIRTGVEKGVTNYNKFCVEYFTGLFMGALDSGAFVDADCGWPEILRAAWALSVRLPAPEAQP